MIHAAHSQHVERTCEFLIGELNLDSDLRDKIFFVSAKEVADDNQEKRSRNRNAGEETYDSMQSRLKEDRKNEWYR